MPVKVEIIPPDYIYFPNFLYIGTTEQILKKSRESYFLTFRWKTGVQIVEFRQASHETAQERSGGSFALGLPRPPHVAQAQCPRLTMPTVSVKRDLLFQALGRTYSECPPHSLVSVPGGARLAQQKGVLAAFVPPHGVWPRTARVLRGALMGEETAGLK